MVISPRALEAHRAWLATGGAGAGARLVVTDEDARGADLTRRDLTRSVVERSSFDGARFAGSTLARARIAGSSFRAAVMGDATLDDAVFVECDFRDADFSVVATQRLGGAGTTARCRFDRCDLRGTVWLDRDLSSAVFVDCQFDLAAGMPRSTTDVLIARPLLAVGEDAAREVAADQILAQWQVGRPQPPLSDDDKAFIHKGLQGRWRKREERMARGPRPPAAVGVGTIADKWSGDFLRADPAPASAGTRTEVARRLTAAGATGAEGVVASLVTVHDLRGLALTIAGMGSEVLDPGAVGQREPLSDRRWRGRDPDGRAVLVAEGPPLRHEVSAIEAMLRMDVPGVTALRYVGAGIESGAMCIEDEPAGTPLIGLVGTLGVREAARVGAALAAVVARAHARGIVLGGIRLETTGWIADGAVCEIAPRFIPFWRSCAEPSSGRGWPEQLACESPEVSSGRQAVLPSDVYSVALATAWLVDPSAAGGPPLEGVLQMQWMQILSGEPHIAPALVAALRPALVRAPEARCSIAELRDNLDACAQAADDGTATEP
jgi:hypothetical protein